MDDGISKQLLIIFTLIIANGLFAMAEMAIVSANKVRLENLAKEGSKGANIALKLGNDPTQMLSTIQTGITLISIITGLYGGAALSVPMANFLKTNFPAIAFYADAISPLLIVTIITYFSLVIGELVPKRIALNNPEPLAIALARPMYLFSVILTPIVKFLSFSTSGIMYILGIKQHSEKPITEDEIKIMISKGAAVGVFEKEEPELVDNIFRLADLNVGDAMTPRTQLSWIDITENEDVIRQKIINTQHYRLPVGNSSLDDLVGIVQISDIFTRDLAMDKKLPLKELILSSILKPLMIPESIPLVKILKLLKEEGVHEAIVLDEFGSFSGLITLHDILEEIVGNMPANEKERREEENRIVKRNENSWYIDGLLNVDEFREYFNITALLPGEDSDLYKTLGGFITYIIGRIPKEADTIEVGPYSFEVADMDNTRVDKILLTYHPELEENQSKINNS